MINKVEIILHELYSENENYKNQTKTIKEFSIKALNENSIAQKNIFLQGIIGLCLTANKEKEKQEIESIRRFYDSTNTKSN